LGLYTTLFTTYVVYDGIPSVQRCFNQPAAKNVHVYNSQRMGADDMLSLEPANPEVVKKFRLWGLGNAAASGGLLGIVEVVKKIFPAAVLGRVPDYEVYIYAAIAISLITVLFLTMIPKVITLSFAQLGVITSMVYIGYSLAGIFIAKLIPVFFALMALAILIMVIVFGQSLSYYKFQKAYSDFVVGCVTVLVTVFACAYPLYILAR
jgi:hypothetical protein